MNRRALLTSVFGAATAALVPALKLPETITLRKSRAVSLSEMLGHAFRPRDDLLLFYQAEYQRVLLENLLEVLVDHTGEAATKIAIMKGRGRSIIFETPRFIDPRRHT